MKRCPQCLFIYPDSDARCDFDNTPLVEVDDAELDAATNPQPASPTKRKRAPRKRPRKVTAVIAVAGLMLGGGAFAVYYRLAQGTHNVVETQSTASVNVTPVAAPPEPHAVSPAPVETASPSPSATPVEKPASDGTATSHTRTTVTPVSTSGPGMGKKLGGKPVILLTSGSKIEADEVWRTRDGVWYRRAGIVTLLKPGRVKAIVNQ